MRKRTKWEPEQIALCAEAWTWAALTRGIEMTEERLSGLIDTCNGQCDPRFMKAAMLRIFREEADTFLPDPSTVIHKTKAEETMARRRINDAMVERRQRMIDAAPAATPEEQAAIRARIARLAAEKSVPRACRNELAPAAEPEIRTNPATGEPEGAAGLRAVREAMERRR